MTLFKTKSAALLALLLGAAAAPTYASIVISEVDPTGSSTSTYAQDWFELTNTGTSAVNISGWEMDDNSNSASNAVALRGATSIGAGQSIVFIESNSSGSNDASIDAAFKSAWFGSKVPAGLVVANYGGSGVGLSSGGDAVNIFDSHGSLVTRVDFGASTTGVTFDNAAGLNNVVLTNLSSVGVNGAFKSADGTEIGSPGSVSAVPVPAAAWLMGSSLAALLGTRARRRS